MFNPAHERLHPSASRTHVAATPPKWPHAARHMAKRGKKTAAGTTAGSREPARGGHTLISAQKFTLIALSPLESDTDSVNATVDSTVVPAYQASPEPA